MNSMFEQAANFNQSIRRWRPNSLQTASGFLSGNNMSFSTLNYDNLLTDWGDGTLVAVDVDMDVQVSRSVSSQNGYNTLVDAGWKINDKGLTT